MINPANFVDKGFLHTRYSTHPGIMAIPKEEGRMDNAEAKRHRLVLIFQYGQKAMQWTQARDAQVRDELRKIEKELGMTAEEIMDEALRNTDIFRQHHRPVGHGSGRPEETPDTSGQ